MITPEEIQLKAARKYTEFLKNSFIGASFFPLEFSVGQLPSDFAELQHYVHNLRDGEKYYRIIWEMKQTRLFGRQTLPKRILIQDQEMFLKLIGKSTEYENFIRDAELIQQKLPALTVWIPKLIDQIIKYHGNWEPLLEVCRYFLEHPRPNCYVRELPLFVHTKFVEEHQSILSQLLDVLMPAETIDLAASRFETRYGLRYDEPVFRVRLLDDQLMKGCNLPIDDLAIPISHLMEFSVNPRTVIIVENKITFLTIPQLPEAIAIWGSGFKVLELRDVIWLAECEVLYWGDLDAQGFEILAGLRVHFPAIKSFLMTEAILERYQAYWVNGVSAKLQDFLHLDLAEYDVYRRLVNNGIRLEQERILHQEVLQALKCLNTG